MVVGLNLEANSNLETKKTPKNKGDSPGGVKGGD